MELQTQTGLKYIRLMKFPAIDGWDIQDTFAAFANSTDAVARRAYVMRVLGHARVVIGSVELPLSTGALIDNHLCTPENVGVVFRSVLTFNGIYEADCLSKSDYSTMIGGEIASSFVAACMGAMEQFVGAVLENQNGR